MKKKRDKKEKKGCYNKKDKKNKGIKREILREKRRKNSDSTREDVREHIISNNKFLEGEVKEERDKIGYSECPECGSKNLASEKGEVYCRNCGYVLKEREE